MTDILAQVAANVEGARNAGEVAVWGGGEGEGEGWVGVEGVDVRHGQQCVYVVCVCRAGTHDV